MTSKKNRPPSVFDPCIALLTSFVYFVQGGLGIAGIAFPLFLRKIGWDISEISIFTFFVGIPWTLKVFYGALSDSYPLAGYRRKPYVILASLLSAGAWIGLCFLPQSKPLLYALASLANLGFAITDVVTDALVVEHSTVTTTQLYQSLSWGFRSLGAVLGGFLGGWLAQNIPYSWIFGFTALLPLSTFLVGFLIRESPRQGRSRISQVLFSLLESLRSLSRGDLKWFCALLLSGTFSASFSTPFFFFLKEHLHFSETFLGILSSLTWLGAIAGCFLYGRFFKDAPIKKTLRWAIGLNFLNTLSAYAVFNALSAASLSIFGGILGYLSLLPLMATAAVLARQKGIEGSLFALLMSVYNAGQILATLAGGKLFDIMGLHPLIFLSAIAGLTGYFFVNRLQTVDGKGK